MMASEEWPVLTDQVSIWSYRQIGRFFRREAARDATSEKEGRGTEILLDQKPEVAPGYQLKGGFPDLHWSVVESGAAYRMQILENRALLCAHLLASWTQEESLLESIKIRLRKLCRMSVVGSPELVQPENRFPGLIGRVLYFRLVPEAPSAGQPREVLLSFARALLSHDLLSCVVVKETLEESAAELDKNDQAAPLLKFQFILMDRSPVILTVHNREQEEAYMQEYYDNGLTLNTKDFPEMWFNTYRPLLYHLSQIVIYWAQSNRFTEFSTIINSDKGMGFSLFSLLNMVLCSFLRTHKNLYPDYPLCSLLLEFFAFIGSFKSHSVAICLLNHEQSYLCKRFDGSVAVGNNMMLASPPLRSDDLARIQVLSPLDWRNDLTSYVTVSRSFIKACRSACKSLLLYTSKGTIDNSCPLLKVILCTNSCIQNRKLDVASCNRVLNTI